MDLRSTATAAILAVACSSGEPAPRVPEPAPKEAPRPPTPEVQVDLHVDTPSRLVDEGMPLDDAALEAGVPRLKEGGANLVVEALWPGRSGDTRGRVGRLLDALEAEVARLDEVAIVTTPDEALATIGEGRIALLVGIEGAHGLAADWRADLDQLHGRGLRVLGLTWSVSNRFAGSSGDAGGGLTDEGRALLSEAWSRDMLVDLSHSSRQTTLEVCGTATVPVIASHSNAAAVCDVPRNLTDEEIRCIAATGGVIGLNLHAPFLCGDRDLRAAADHLDHLAKVGGHEAVSLSTDFDGNIQVPAGLEHEGRIPALLDELRRRGWTEAQLRALRGENFMRAWRAATSAER